MNKSVYLIGAAVLIGVLAGCAASPELAGVQPLVDAPSVTPESTEPPTIAVEEPANPAEANFDVAIRRVPGLENVDAADALAVGYDVCEQLAAGISPLDILPVENADQQVNEEVVLVSVLTICTEYNDATQAVFIARRVG